MPARDVRSTEAFDRFVSVKVASGRCGHASAAVRGAWRTPEHHERADEAKLAVLRSAIAEGDASGVVKGPVFARVGRRKLAGVLR